LHSQKLKKCSLIRNITTLIILILKADPRIISWQSSHGIRTSPPKGKLTYKFFPDVLKKKKLTIANVSINEKRYCAPL
jgi:hypothetical protein